VGGIFFDYQDGQGQLYRGPQADGAAAVYSNQIGPQHAGWEEVFTFSLVVGKHFTSMCLLWSGGDR